MLFRHRYVVILAIIATLFCAVSASAGESVEGKRTLIIPHVDKAPVFDGVLGDSAWKGGALMSEFTSINETSTPIQQTTVRALYDSKYLYLGIKCYENNMAGLIAKCRGADSRIWTDDDVELFLDTTNTKHMYYHLTRNPFGAYADNQSTTGGASESSWASHCIVKTGRDSDGWIVEMAIPFDDLGVSPTPGIVWGINVCRGRLAGTTEYSAWSPTPGKFGRPNNFGRFVFGDNSGNWNGVRLLSWGDLDPVNGLESKNTLLCSVPNFGSETATFKATLSELGKGKSASVYSTTVTVPPGKTAPFEMPYQATNTSVEGWSLNIDSNGKEIFNATHKAVSVVAKQRVWEIKDPLYKELLSETPPGLQQNGCIYWLHTYQPVALYEFGQEYGIRYSNEEALKELADSKLLVLMNESMIEDPFFRQMADKYHIKVLFVPDTTHWTAPDAPIIGGTSFLLDSRSRKHYFDGMKYAITKWRKYIWGIYTGDEITEGAIRQADRLFIDHKNDYPYILQVNEQVKKNFGFGKYGMPESLDDTNPYRWIALRKWVSSSLADWQKEVYDTVHSLAPEMKVISIDPVAGHKPVGLDRMSPYFDIATHQLYPPSNPNRQQFGFTTKMVSDITGKPTWPCTHVENYAFSTTLDEVSELLSEVMRNGGKGFHYWLCDEQGNNSPNGYMLATKYGFPERWRALVELNLLNASMKEVAVPKDPDAAILYSEDYYQSFNEKAAEYPYFYTNEPEWAYTFFGPVSRTWFKFINENMIDDRKVDLSNFKAVIVPAAKYERGNTADALLKYVTSGGTLLVGDPEAFSSDINGEPLTEVRAKLIGSTLPGKDQTSLKFSADCSMPNLRNRTLAVTGSSYSLTPGANSEIMARFSDGSPAVLRNRVGKGSVILFACNPFTESGIADQAWKDFFKALSQDLGLKTDRDIWRFKFPAYKTVIQPEPQGTCLTGNYIKWWQDKPKNVHNTIIPGTYSYSLSPDAIGERETSPVVPFTTGKLTDRQKAFTTLKTVLKPGDFVVSWKNEKPVEITFDLLDVRSVTRLNLWYTGQLPSIKVEGSIDGTTWTKLAKSKKRSMMKQNDVLDISLNLASGSQARYLRLSLDKRDPGNALTLAECEIWGDTAQ